MKTKRFTLTEGQQNELRANPHVRKVSARMVQYTADFKRRVLAARASGQRPRDLFVEAGIPLQWFAKNHVKQRVRAWSKITAQHGYEHLTKEHRGRDGLVLKQWRDKELRYKTMTDQEKVKYLETEVEALEHVRRHFQLPPSIHQSPNSRRRPNTK